MKALTTLLILFVVIAFGVGLYMDATIPAQPVAVQDDPMTHVLIGFAVVFILAMIIAHPTGAIEREGWRVNRDD